MQIKFGVYSDYGIHKDSLKDLLLFYSSSEKKPVTLKAVSYTHLISMVATIIPMLFYKVTESKQREYVKEIEERKAAKAAKTAE